MRKGREAWMRSPTASWQRGAGFPTATPFKFHASSISMSSFHSFKFNPLIPLFFILVVYNFFLNIKTFFYLMKSRHAVIKVISIFLLLKNIKIKNKEKVVSKLILSEDDFFPDNFFYLIEKGKY